jgi:hypothetical protein
MEYLASFHQMSVEDTSDGIDAFPDIPPEPDPPQATLLAHMAKKRDLPPGDIQRLLSPSMAKGSQSGPTRSVVIDGVTYTANIHIQYRASSHHHVRSGALVDRGANGGIAGGDVRVINRTG